MQVFFFSAFRIPKKPNKNKLLAKKGAKHSGRRKRNLQFSVVRFAEND
jgi:hypothetical protein